MNILVLNGSPKGSRSNTMKLTEAFIEGVAQNTPNTPPDIERLDISSMNISSCLGCFSCWNKTPGKCCLSDDMGLVIDKLLWADVTIWSFPLYYFGLPGKLKTMMDRQLPMNLPFMAEGAEGGGHPSRYDMSGKKTVLISTCGFYSAESNYDTVRAQFDRICGKNNYTAIFCGEGELFRVPELKKRTDEYLDVVRRAGKEYAAGGISRETDKELAQLLYPRDVFERMADASWGVSPEGEKEDSSLVFTRQMAALYDPAAYPGHDVILDMDYTDVGRRLRIILGKDGSRVTDDLSGEAATVIHTPLTVWQSIAAGEIEGPEAMMKHMYSVDGDFELMLKWDDYFGGGQQKAAPKEEPREDKTNMLCMLLPWTALWVGPAIDDFYGCLAALAVCLLTPLVFLKTRKTVYDVLSTAVAGICAIAMLAGAKGGYVLPLSYLAFGAMWSLTGLFKVPLTAEYSMNNYGGRTAFRNPVFIKTNRILTLCWGVLYLLTAPAAYFITRSSLSPYLGAINSVLPAMMGIFTAWFQKWYPKKVAEGKIR